MLENRARFGPRERGPGQVQEGGSAFVVFRMQQNRARGGARERGPGQVQKRARIGPRERGPGYMFRAQGNCEQWS